MTPPLRIKFPALAASEFISESRRYFLDCPMSYPAEVLAIAAYLADSPRGADAVLAKFHKLSAFATAITMIAIATFSIKINLGPIVQGDGGAVL